MMRFVFPAVFAVFIALLFYEVYSLSHSLSEFDLPNPSRPNPLQVLTPTPAPAPDVTPEPKLDAVAATPAPAPDVTPEPKLDAVAATPAPAPDVAAEPKLGAAPKAQSAPKVLRKVEPAAGRERAEAPPKRKRVTATGPTGAAGAITGRERARPPERDFGQSTGELPP
ncbi:MAG TPA: hypothetical protein VHT68_06330 [Pseudolabrys sp.]|jgi:outer membrane biosynthesis protein TonB|nr:hypothetical protein [Pseudolabrys sp.]